MPREGGGGRTRWLDALEAEERGAEHTEPQFRSGGRQRGIPLDGIHLGIIIIISREWHPSDLNRFSLALPKNKDGRRSLRFCISEPFKKTKVKREFQFELEIIVLTAIEDFMKWKKETECLVAKTLWILVLEPKLTFLGISLPS